VQQAGQADEFIQLNTLHIQESDQPPIRVLCAVYRDLDAIAY